MNSPLNHEALVELGRALRRERYAFVAVTPETHRRADANAEARGRGDASTLRDVFGWNRPFDDDVLPRGIFDLLRAANAIERRGGRSYARVRFATLGEGLYVHGAYPTTEADAVFFGPDTYRFCALIAAVRPSARSVVDIGCGSGAGGLVAGVGAERIVLADVNPAALALSRVNATLANASHVEITESDVLASIEGRFDRIVANPPYLVDASERRYRHGGGGLGSDLSVRIVREALPRLTPGGVLIVYTGAPIVDGVDLFLQGVLPLITEFDGKYTYSEIDPDVFGEELDTEPYRAVDRIAAVGLVVTAR